MIDEKTKLEASKILKQVKIIINGIKDDPQETGEYIPDYDYHVLYRNLTVLGVALVTKTFYTGAETPEYCTEKWEVCIGGAGPDDYKLRVFIMREMFKIFELEYNIDVTTDW